MKLPDLFGFLRFLGLSSANASIQSLEVDASPCPKQFFVLVVDPQIAEEAKLENEGILREWHRIFAEMGLLPAPLLCLQGCKLMRCEDLSVIKLLSKGA